MELISLLFLLFVFAILAIFVDRRIQARVQAREAAAATSAPPTTETKAEPGWRTRFRRPSQPETIALWRAWAATTFAGQPQVQTWLAALPDESVRMLIDKLAAFCTDLGFDLAWLIENKLDTHAALTPQLHSVAKHFVDACYQATLIHDDVQAYQAWQDFTQNPYGKEQQALALQLFTALLEQGLTPTAASSLLTVPEKERQVYIVQAIREAAEKKPTAFQAVLKAVVTAPVNNTPAIDAVLNQLKRPWIRRTPVTTTAAVDGQPAANGL